MKVRLLDPDSDISLEPRTPPRLADMVEDDLELRTLYKVMANGDQFLYDVANKVIPLGVTDPVVIEYRQDVLSDCMANQPVVQQMYDIAVDAVEVRKKVFLGGMLFRDPKAIVHSSVQILGFLTENLKQLRGLRDQHADQFGSDGFGQFMTMISEELSDDYLAQLDEHLAELMMPRGVLLSSQLGLGNKGRRLILHQPPRRSWWEKLTGNHNGGYGFELDPRDQAGCQALNELAGRALNDVANTVTQSADHVKGFFERLRTELGFYLGCVNLHARLTTIRCAHLLSHRDTDRSRRVSVPRPARRRIVPHHTHTVTGNDIDADGKSLIVVTGANEGGKSTFLRSVGTAQTMMQDRDVRRRRILPGQRRTRGTFTHFKREEDTTTDPRQARPELPG